MKQTAIMLVVLGIFIAGNPSARGDSGNPFGFETNKHPLEYEYCKKDPGRFNFRGHGYTCSSAPRPHPDLKSYTVQFVKGIGLCRLHAVADNFRPTVAFNNAVETLKGHIAKKYGSPTKETKEATEATESLHAQERQIYWSPEAGFKGLGNVKAIEVWASEIKTMDLEDKEEEIAVRGLRVSIQFVTVDECVEAIDDKASRAF